MEGIIENEMLMALCTIKLLRKLRLRRKQQNRRYWVHPLNSVRLSLGQFYTTYHDLRKDNDKFFNYFRMSSNTFDELLRLLSPHIKGIDTNMRLSIPPNEKLAVTLR